MAWVPRNGKRSCIFEMHPTSVKHIYMVDAGLAYNSPYPLILRPQREVDIILSFDFSARPLDNDPPFKELLLAEKWARLNRLPFPPIDTSVFDRDGMKELYIFRHPTDPYCPVVFHFILINKKFKYYKKPEIPRETKEEFDFAEFDVFDDPRAPYSTFNFTYTNNDFERLSQLMEFNTLLHINDIKEVIRDVIKKKREAPPRMPIQSRDIKLMRMKSLKEARKLQHFISRMDSRSSFHFGGSPSTPFFTPSPNGEASTNPFFSGFRREMPRRYSVDNIIYSKRDRLSRNVCKSVCHDPSDIFSKTKQFKFDTSAKTDFIKKPSKFLHSLSMKNVYRTPSDSADYLHHSEQKYVLNKSESSVNKEYKTDLCYEKKSEHTSSILESLSTGSDKNTLADQAMAGLTVDQIELQSTKRHMLSPKLKLPGTLEFTPNESFDHCSISSGFGSLSTDANSSWDISSNFDKDSSGKITPGTNVSSTENTRSENLNSDSSYEKPVRKVKKNPPPNPFFAKAFLNRSSHESSSNSSTSSQAGSHSDHRSIKSHNGLSDQLSPQMLQLINSVEDRENVKIIASLDSRSSRPKPLNLSTFNKPSSVGDQPSPSLVTPEIFSLAPEAFKADGTPVFNSEKAKMYYESVKDKRKIFRRQSTVSSLKNISLDGDPSHGDEYDTEVQFSSSKKKMTYSSDTQFTECARTSYEDMEQDMDINKIEISNTETTQIKSDCEVDFEILDLSQFMGVSDADEQVSGESVS